MLPRASASPTPWAERSRPFGVKTKANASGEEFNSAMLSECYKARVKETFRNAMAEGRAAGLPEQSAALMALRRLVELSNAWIAGYVTGYVVGFMEGLVAARQDDLLDLLRERFTNVPPEVEARIRAVTDPERLRTALRQVLKINSPAEIPL